MVLLISIGIISNFCCHKLFPLFILSSAVVWSTLLGLLAKSSIRLSKMTPFYWRTAFWHVSRLFFSICHFYELLQTLFNFCSNSSIFLWKMLTTIRLNWLQQTKHTYSTSHLLCRSIKGMTPFGWSPYVKNSTGMKTGYTIQNSL